MPRIIVVTHPEVTVDPDIPITEWGLSNTGRQRAAAFATSPHVESVSHIWSSAERKARETADILAVSRNLTVQIEPRLGENDRSATGFLPPAQFEAAADAFFANPEVSHQGWETATDAQARIFQAVSEIVENHTGGDLAIVTHGAVGTLLWCALSEHQISRRYDQPGQGHFWEADLATLRPTSGWQRIA